MAIKCDFEPSDDVVIKAKHTQSDYLRLGGNSVVTTFQPEANIAASNALMYAVMGTFFLKLLNSQQPDIRMMPTEMLSQLEGLHRCTIIRTRSG